MELIHYIWLNFKNNIIYEKISTTYYPWIRLQF